MFRIFQDFHSKMESQYKESSRQLAMDNIVSKVDKISDREFVEFMSLCLVDPNNENHKIPTDDSGFINAHLASRLHNNIRRHPLIWKFFFEGTK